MEKVIVLGSGPAGLTAAIYLARANLNPLVLTGSNPGGQLMATSYVENWPGEQSILGPNLMNKIYEHAKYFQAKLINQDAIKVNLNVRPFEIITKRDIYYTHSLIIATGSIYKKLHCKGEDYYINKGVTNCAICDGAFYKDKPVLIVGGGDSAMENALFMTNYTKDITIVHRSDQLTASEFMKNKVISNKNIKIIYNSTIVEIFGDNDHVQGAVVQSNHRSVTQNIKVDAIFVSIGLSPNTHIFKDQLEMSKSGHIVLKKGMQSSVEGVFSCGDVEDFIYRQAIVSAGSGCKAALDCERYLKGLDI
jgi:thioredoxin reductase (NADPH)